MGGKVVVHRAEAVEHHAGLRNQLGEGHRVVEHAHVGRAPCGTRSPGARRRPRRGGASAGRRGRGRGPSRRAPRRGSPRRRGGRGGARRRPPGSPRRGGARPRGRLEGPSGRRGGGRGGGGGGGAREGEGEGRHACESAFPCEAGGNVRPAQGRAPPAHIREERYAPPRAGEERSRRGGRRVVWWRGGAYGAVRGVETSRRVMAER